MWSKVWIKLQTTVFGGAVIVASSWIVSKALGLVREQLIATTFGTTGAVPIYTAFAIPDFIYGTLILGSLLTSFMPVFLAYYHDRPEEAWRISRSILSIVIWVFAGASLLLFFGAEPVGRALLFGKHFTPHAQAETITLMRIMSLNMLLFAVSNLFAGVLQSLRHFLAVSLAPIVNNLGLIFGLLVLAKPLGAAGVAWGAVIGASAHLIIQFAAAWRAGWRPGPSAGWRHPGVRQIGQLLIPRTIGQSVTQIDQFVNVPIANQLGTGNLSIFHWANTIQDAPIGIIGVSMATVAFPVFVEQLRQGKKKEFVSHFSLIIRQVLFLIIPITVLVIQLRAQLVRVIIAHGSHPISGTDTIATAQTLGFFALSFFAQSLIPVLARSFYAMRDTRTPVKMTTIAVVVDIIGSIVLGFTMGVTGLALSFTISSILNATLLFAALHRRIGSLDEERIFQSVLRIIGVTILMALTVQGTKYVLVSFGVSLSRAVGVLTQLLVAGAVGMIAYVLFAAFFKLEEASLIRGAIIKFFQRFRNGRANGVTP